MKSSRQQSFSEADSDVFAALWYKSVVSYVGARWVINLLTVIHVDATHLNVCQIVVNTGAFRDAVAFVEVESRSKHVLTEPNLSKGVEEPLVIVVSHAAAILNLSDHVSHRVPWHALRGNGGTGWQWMKIWEMVRVDDQILDKRGCIVCVFFEKTGNWMEKAFFFPC